MVTSDVLKSTVEKPTIKYTWYKGKFYGLWTIYQLKRNEKNIYIVR